MKDYASESERKAYNKGVIARINGLSKSDCPYMLYHNVKCWLAGYNEKGSIAEKNKQKAEVVR